MNDALCPHCLSRRQGQASVTDESGTHYLCHPDFGLDCYELVTVHHHTYGPIGCTKCFRGDTESVT